MLRLLQQGHTPPPPPPRGRHAAQSIVLMNRTSRASLPLRPQNTHWICSWSVAHPETAKSSSKGSEPGAGGACSRGPDAGRMKTSLSIHLRRFNTTGRNPSMPPKRETWKCALTRERKWRGLKERLKERCRPESLPATGGRFLLL